jgi:hypothetical protein
MKPRISDEMFETIPSMVEQGMSAQEIALQLGVSNRLAVGDVLPSRHLTAAANDRQATKAAQVGGRDHAGQERVDLVAARGRANRQAICQHPDQRSAHAHRS